MTGLGPLASEFGLSIDELTVWVERRWVLPGRSGGDFSFNEADRARLRMIVEFRHDLAIDDEAMPVVLDLVDRLHAVHAQLRRVLEATADLPATERDMVLGRLFKEDNA
jgi:chaperone modulatory protein CbpM